MIITILIIALALLIYARTNAAANKRSRDLAVRKINSTIDQFSGYATASGGGVALGVNCKVRIKTNEEIEAERAARRYAKKKAKAERVAKALERATHEATAETRKPVRL